jgi:hypothetical protein
MTFLNVGAQIDNHDAPSKKALKIALAEAPERVSFYTTAGFFDGEQSFDGEHVPEGVFLQVTGPNPYTKRNFYATVRVATSGRNAGKVVLT